MNFIGLSTKLPTDLNIPVNLAAQPGKLTLLQFWSICDFEKKVPREIWIRTYRIRSLFILILWVSLKLLNWKIFNTLINNLHIPIIKKLGIADRFAEWNLGLVDFVLGGLRSYSLVCFTPEIFFRRQKILTPHDLLLLTSGGKSFSCFPSIKNPCCICSLHLSTLAIDFELLCIIYSLVFHFNF